MSRPDERTRRAWSPLSRGEFLTLGFGLWALSGLIFSFCWVFNLMNPVTPNYYMAKMQSMFRGELLLTTGISLLGWVAGTVCIYAGFVGWSKK